MISRGDAEPMEALQTYPSMLSPRTDPANAHPFRLLGVPVVRRAKLLISRILHLHSHHA